MSDQAAGGDEEKQEIARKCGALAACGKQGDNHGEEDPLAKDGWAVAGLSGAEAGVGQHRGGEAGEVFRKRAGRGFAGAAVIAQNDGPWSGGGEQVVMGVNE